MFRLDQKVCLITGAATGIGYSTAALFARRGGTVILTDQDGDRVRDAAASLQPLSPTISFAPCDVSDSASVSEVVANILRAHARLDIVVSNAGIIHIGTILETDYSDFRRVMAVNADGPFHVMKACLPTMVTQRSGAIVQIASVSAEMPLHSRFAYAVSKAAAQMITRSVAHDFAKFGIRANSICPARVHTEMVDNALRSTHTGSEEAVLAALHALQPLGRMIRPDETAALALYLCCDESAMVTGSSFLIDGGLLAGV